MTSKSASASNFASDTPFLRSVRPKIGSVGSVFHSVRSILRPWVVVDRPESSLCSGPRLVRVHALFESTLCSSPRFVQVHGFFESMLFSSSRLVRAPRHGKWNSNSNPRFESSLCSSPRFFESTLFRQNAFSTERLFEFVFVSFRFVFVSFCFRFVSSRFVFVFVPSPSREQKLC